MKRFLSSVLFTLFFTSAYSQTAADTIWSLEECVNYALEHNIQVQRSRLQTETDKNNLETAKWEYVPDLGGRASYGWNFGLNIDPVTNQISQSTRQTGSFALSSNWVLYNGGRIYNTIALSNLDYMASVFDLEAVKNDISLNVASAYLQILLNKEILAVALEQERITQLQVNRTSRLVEAGAVARGDLLQLQAQYARDQQNFISAQNAVLIGKLQLASLLQLSDPDDFEITDPQIELPEAALIARDPASIFAAAIENQPTIKAAETRVSGSEENIDISQAGFLPTLSLTGLVSTSYSDQILEPTGMSQQVIQVPFFDENGNLLLLQQTQTIPDGFEEKEFSNQIEDNINEYVGINLSIPIFNKMRVRNNVQNARVTHEQVKLNLEQEKNNLRQTIYQAHADARASYNSYLAAEKAVEASQESFTYAEERFEVGALNQFDYENAKNSLAAAKSDMVRAKYDYIFKIKVLEFYLTNQVKL